MIVCLAAACDTSTGGNNGIDAGEPDAKKFEDAPPVVEGQFTLSGRTYERGLGGETAVSGVTLEVYASSDESKVIKSAMSNQAGEFSMTIMTTGPLDGYILAKKTGYVDVYMYPTEPFEENFTDAAINMITPSNKDFLNSLAGGMQMPGMGLVGLQVRDAAGNPVMGATVSSNPASGAYKYTGSNGLPASGATSTSMDGVAFMFNVPTNAPVMVTASKSGLTFKAHPIKARGDKMTVTSVTE